MNRPSFQFYPADWQANSNLRRCSFEEKGIWLEIICLLHDQATYGVSRWSLKDIAQAVGCNPSKLKGLVDKGVLKGADDGGTSPALVYTPRSGRKLGTSITLLAEQPGPLWYSSRMVEDEYKRVIRGEAGGTPKPTRDPSPKGGIGADIDATPKPTPDPSPFSCTQASRAAPSSSSSSPKEKQNHTSAEPPFDPLAELILRGVMKQTAQDWLKVRKAKRAPLTASALTGVVNEAAKAGMSLEQALLVSCRRGWASFEAKWLKEEDVAGAVPSKKDWE